MGIAAEHLIRLARLHREAARDNAKWDQRQRLRAVAPLLVEAMEAVERARREGECDD